MTCLRKYSGGVVSGGKDGMIKLWDYELSPVAEFDVRALKISVNPRVRAIDVSTEGTKILVGTQGSEIFEIHATDGSNVHDKALVQAHFKGQLWGLAMHPTEPEFATVGDDSTLRVWDMTNLCVKDVKEMDSPARAITYRPDGEHIVVGLGAGIAKGNKRDGGFVAFQAKDLAVVYEGRDTQEWVRELVFSPDNRRLALASEDNQIYLYDAKDNYSRQAVLNPHAAPVTALDFSTDSLYIMSTDLAGVLYFCDVNAGVQVRLPSCLPVCLCTEITRVTLTVTLTHSHAPPSRGFSCLPGLQIPNPNALKDVEWASQTCPLGWAVQGFHMPLFMKSEVTSVARSNDKRLILSGALPTPRLPSLLPLTHPLCSTPFVFLTAVHLFPPAPSFSSLPLQRTTTVGLKWLTSRCWTPWTA